MNNNQITTNSATQILVNSSAWGSGKTTKCLNPDVIAQRQSNQNVILVVKSLDACDTAKITHPSAVVINSKVKQQKCSAQLKTALKKGFNFFIVTQQTFHEITADVLNPSDWIVHYDEITTSIDSHYIKFNKGDRVSFSVNSEEATPFTEINTLDINVIKCLDVFKLQWKQVTIYASNFEQTSMGRVFTLDNIPFTITHPFIPLEGSRITFVCPILSKKQPMLSTSLKQSNPKIVTKMRSKIDKKEPVITLRNVKDNLVDSGLLNEVVLAFNNQGSNKFRAVNQVLIEATLNASFGSMANLKSTFNLSNDDVMVITAIDTFVQTMLRSSLRDADSIEPVRIVCCPEVARICMERFVTNATIEFFDVGIKEKVVLTRAEISARQRAKAKKLLKAVL